MAIDTKSLTEVITEFRALQSKDAVSPESLGYILQRIVDLLSTAGTSETVANIQKLLDGFKAAGQSETILRQPQEWRMGRKSSGNTRSKKGRPPFPKD